MALDGRFTRVCELHPAWLRSAAPPPPVLAHTATAAAAAASSERSHLPQAWRQPRQYKQSVSCQEQACSVLRAGLSTLLSAFLLWSGVLPVCPQLASTSSGHPEPPVLSSPLSCSGSTSAPVTDPIQPPVCSSTLSHAGEMLPPVTNLN